MRRRVGTKRVRVTVRCDMNEYLERQSGERRGRAGGGSGGAGRRDLSAACGVHWSRQCNVHVSCYSCHFLCRTACLLFSR